MVNETYEKIRKQGAKAFVSATEPTIVEEWLRSTERILDRFECTAEKKVCNAISLFEQDALDWWEIIPGSKNVPMTLTWEEFLREFAKKYTLVVY